MTLDAAGKAWVSLDLREDRLDGLRVGAPVTLVRAEAGTPIAADIDEIRPYGEFATWRAARPSGHTTPTHF